MKPDTPREHRIHVVPVTRLSPKWEHRLMLGIRGFGSRDTISGQTTLMPKIVIR